MEAALSITPDDVRVDSSSIEKSLADIWRAQRRDGDGEQAVTRAALWNVVAHAATAELQAHASETLSRASAAVPQRTIVIRSQRHESSDLSAWISANCHLIGGGKQVCSEEVAIVASGDRVRHVPPLVNALLIPDMPVAVWWLGDLPDDESGYVESLLEPADRLIVDSMHFDGPEDLDVVRRVAEATTTAPADLNWVRLEDWRTVTAMIFDPPDMRPRLGRIRSVRIATASDNDVFFGQSTEALLFAAWFSGQAKHHIDEQGKVEGPLGAIEYRFERVRQSIDTGMLAMVEITFNDGLRAQIGRNLERGILFANVDGEETTPECVARVLGRRADELIVRQLKRAERDHVFVRSLPLAQRLAGHFA